MSQFAARSRPPLALSRPTIFPSAPRNFAFPAPTSLESQTSLVRVYTAPSVEVNFPAGQLAEILYDCAFSLASCSFGQRLVSGSQLPHHISASFSVTLPLATALVVPMPDFELTLGERHFEHRDIHSP